MFPWTTDKSVPTNNELGLGVMVNINLINLNASLLIFLEENRILQTVWLLIVENVLKI